MKIWYQANLTEITIVSLPHRKQSINNCQPYQGLVTNSSLEPRLEIHSYNSADANRLATMTDGDRWLLIKMSFNGKVHERRNQVVVYLASRGAL